MVYCYGVRLKLYLRCKVTITVTVAKHNRFGFAKSRSSSREPAIAPYWSCYSVQPVWPLLHLAPPAIRVKVDTSDRVGVRVTPAIGVWVTSLNSTMLPTLMGVRVQLGAKQGAGCKEIP